MSSVTIREADFNDEYAVQQLSKRNGLEIENINNTWKQIWKGNKFYSADWAIGWILEFDSIVVGFIGNIPRAYSFLGKQWVAGVAHSFVVDKRFRAHTLLLIAEFFKQKHADLLIFSSANSDAESVYRLAKARCIPQKDYHNDLFWIVTPKSFIFSLLRKKGLNAFMSVIFSMILVPIIYVEMFLRRRWSNRVSGEIKIEPLSEIGNDINKLWEQLQKENSDRLLSYRDKDALIWQFFNSDKEVKRPLIFTSRREGELVGYALVTRADSPKFRLNRMIITDLVVLSDDKKIIKELMNAIFYYARNINIALLQLVGFPTYIRNPLKPLYPFNHTLPYKPFWYFPINKELQGVLENESIWYASTFDGDSSI